MNELNCSSLCQLLCCPPIPSKIVAKLAFMPPPQSYDLVACIENEQTNFYFRLFSPCIDDYFSYLTSNIQATKATTRKGNEIAIIYLPINPINKLTFFISHGNAADLGLLLNFVYELGSKLNVNIMCYDYSGYGASTGKPLEKNLYADAECALSVLRTKYEVPLNKIVLYGQSIGTVPTVYLATIYRVAAVVLHSPLMSGLRVVFPNLKRNYCCDVFSNLARVPKIISPTLVIHGTQDEVVNVAHGYRLYSALANHLLLDPLFIDGAGHNNCELYPQYLIRLAKLVNVELPILSRSSDTNVENKEDDLFNVLSINSDYSTTSESASICANEINDTDVENNSTRLLISSHSNKVAHKKFSKCSVDKEIKSMEINGNDSLVSAFSSKNISDFVEPDQSLIKVHALSNKSNDVYKNIDTHVSVHVEPLKVYDLASSGNIPVSKSWSSHNEEQLKSRTLDQDSSKSEIDKQSSSCLSLSKADNIIQNHLSLSLDENINNHTNLRLGKSSFSCIASSNSTKVKPCDGSSSNDSSSGFIETKLSAICSRASQIFSQTLIIHGAKDEIINIRQVQQLYEIIPNTLVPLYIQGAGHNNCELFQEYLIRLEYLVYVELDEPDYSDLLTNRIGPDGPNLLLSRSLSDSVNNSKYRLSESQNSSYPSNFVSISNHMLSKHVHNTDCSENTSNLSKSKTTSGLPVWTRTRGTHGSYRYISRFRSNEKCKSRIATPVVMTNESRASIDYCNQDCLKNNKEINKTKIANSLFKHLKSSNV